ncbi:HNH endonuclease [Thermanaeromonas toyohensis ToBE]|uniref:HNH endonuclease n=1 Tax=Thermanaeromonas toyohensis ToBE TaxID=698762 RepID=A0A1W1VVM2_9FIRM|nr:RNA-guided endonuclease IscB [Thermanaeromonas toyohensis]SMB97151.1 HNH endonuclease [Thermanaeromonas toyohensis ToBE]
MMVLVQNKDGSPLSPCHPARARIMLKKGKAKVVCTYPFTIKLTYKVENPVFAPTRAVLDDGKTCGLGVVQENRTHNLALCKAEMETRGEEISDNLKRRKELRAQRRRRRNKKRGREGRIKIRYRKGQEYPQSIVADVQAKVNAVKRLMKMYPITEIVLEPVKLDIVKELNPGVRGKDYQRGLSYGIEADTRNQKRRLAILRRDGYRCLYCGREVTEETARIHHFVQRKHGGTKRYDILGTLCEECHTSVSTGELALAFDLESYPNIRAAGRCMHGRHLLERELRKLGVPVVVKYGYEAQKLRERYGFPKSHGNDAVVLGCNPEKGLIDRSTVYKVKLHARHGGRKLFDANPGVAAYRGQADRQPHVDWARMVVDDHNHEWNRKNRSYRRHVRNKYYKKLKEEGKFNYDLLPGRKHLNEIFTVNRAMLLTEGGPVLVKNQRIREWRYPHPWPDRRRVIERYDLVRTQKGGVGIVTSIMSDCTVRVDFVKKREGYKTDFSFYRPEALEIIQKGSSQTWVIQE